MFEKQGRLINTKVIETVGIWIAVIILGSALFVGQFLK